MEKLQAYEYGYVELVGSDIKTGLFATKTCCPFILLQSITDILVSSGNLSNIQIRNPIAIWIPKLGMARFKSSAASIPNVNEVVYTALREEALKLANLYVHLGQYVCDPTDLINLLPLGTYVTFDYSTHVDNLISILERLDKVAVEGVSDLIWAFSGILKSVLIDFERIRLIETTRALNTKSS
jgi:hypothetical protein